MYHSDKVKAALAEIKEHSCKYGAAFTKPEIGETFCKLKLANLAREHFLVIYLTSQHQYISSEIISKGTIDRASIYPREVIRAALLLNCKAIIISHNHPSGLATPSQEDRTIIKKLQRAFDLFDGRVIDHIIIGTNTSYSMVREGDI